MDTQNIPWRLIANRLEALGPGRHQAWLARELNVGSNVIANWRTRGGAPLSRAADLARVLGMTTDELLKPATSPLESNFGPLNDREEALLTTYRSLSVTARLELRRFAEYLLAKDRGEA